MNKENLKTEKNFIEENIQDIFTVGLGFWHLLSFLSLDIPLFKIYDYYYESISTEIIDKAQDTEMSLPTNLTIFNRSMINLENEIGVLIHMP